MAPRDLRDNAALDHCLGQFSSCPVTDGPVCRLFTGEGHNPAGLFRCDLGWPPWTWSIGQSIFYRQILQRCRLQPDPALAPAAHRLIIDAQLTGDLAIVRAFSGGHDHAPPQCKLLAGGMAADQAFEILTFLLA